jgi:hypothetical protein
MSFYMMIILLGIKLHEMFSPKNRITEIAAAEFYRLSANSVPINQGPAHDYSTYSYEARTSPYVTAAPDLAIGDDEALDFALSKVDKRGVTYYPYEQDGKDLDVYVQIDSVTNGLRLLSYPADRVGGSKGPAETAVQPKTE